MNRCNPPITDCDDKDSAHYFTFHMTPKEWEERMGKFTVEWGGNLRCTTSDGKTVNMAEELNRIKNPRKRKIYDN